MARHKAKATIGKGKQRLHTTLGDLIAAAYDAVGDEAKKAVDLLRSDEVSRITRQKLRWV